MCRSKCEGCFQHQTSGVVEFDDFAINRGSGHFQSIRHADRKGIAKLDRKTLEPMMWAIRSRILMISWAWIAMSDARPPAPPE